MAKKTKKAAKPAEKPFIGVATTTTVAFVQDGRLALERMSALSEEGAGILCDEPPPVGAKVQVAFKVSTARETVRCYAEVLDHFPTTPAGLALRKKIGDRAFKASMGAAIGDSATAIFRMGDLEQAHAKKKAATEEAATMAQANGFAVRFTDLDEEGRSIVKKHVAISRKMSEQLAARGNRLVSIAEDERKTMQALFDEGDLARRALDW